MKIFTKLNVLVLLALFVAVPFVSGVYSGHVSAQEGENQQEQQEEQQAEEAPAEEEQNQEEAATYNYTAQPGDNYSLLARKAIQTYGINNDVNLSTAQIIYAETMLTQEAGAPELNVGQEVTIEESTVQNWVDKAGELSDEAEAAWNEYTVGVDFNTDSVGESQE